MAIIEIISFIQYYYVAIIFIVGFLVSVIALVGKTLSDSITEDTPPQSSLIFLGLGFIFQQLKKPILVIASILTVLQLAILYINSDTTLAAVVLLRIIDIILLLVLYRSWISIYDDSKPLTSRMYYFKEHEKYLKEYQKNKHILKDYWRLQSASLIFILCIGIHIYANIFSQVDLLWVGINACAYLYVLRNAADLAAVSIPKHRMMIYTIDKNKPPIEAFFIRWERNGLRAVTKKSEVVIPRSQIKMIEYP
jgi:hypothetical protein